MNTGDIITFDVKKNFTFIRPLGGGGTGDTYLFKDETTNMLFAIKKYVPKDTRYIEEHYTRFVDEIKILFNISHPNIVRIYNYYLYPHAKTGFLQTEYIEGTCIDQYTPMPWDEKGWEGIFTDVISAFEYLEKNNILHRDIRPANIMIDQHGNVKIIDFGFGKQLDGSRNDENSILLNWPATEMPNEVQFNQEYDERTEIFFVGTLFRHILKDELEDFRFQHIIEKMIKLHPDQRYTSFAAIMSDITAGVLSEIDFTEEQKTCYRNFADALCSHISSYLDKYEPFDDIGQTLSKLAELIRNSSLENSIQDNRQLIECFITGGYRYSTRKNIDVQVVSDFYGLVTTLEPTKRKILFANIYTRLAAIAVIPTDPELPF